MSCNSYFPNYFSIEDILITQSRVQSKQNINLPNTPLDENTKSEKAVLSSTVDLKDLDTMGVLLPLWYFNEMRSSTSYFTPVLPEMYGNVYKAVCEADYTNINLGKLHPEFYEYGRYLIPFDSTNLIGRILYQTLCHRVQHLLDSSKTIFKAQSSQNKMDRLEGHLLEMGIKTYKLFLDWYQFNFIKIQSSALVADHKRRRDISDDLRGSKSAKRIYGS